MTQRAAATHGKLQWVRADGSWHASGRSAEPARSYHVYQERQSFQATVREGGQTYDLGIHKSAEAAKGAAEEYEKRYAVAAEAGRVGRGEKIKEITVGLPGDEALIEVYKNEVNRYTPFVTWGSGFGVEGERQETLKDAIAEGRRIADAGPAAGVEATECATCPAEITAAKNCMPNADSLIRQAETKLTYGEREADVHVWLQHEGCDADQAFLILAAAKILAADVAQVGIESTVPTSDVHPQSTSEPCGPCALEAVARDFNTQDEALSHAASHGFTHYVKKGRKFLVFGQGPDGTTSSARMYRHKGKYHFTEAKLSKDPMPKRAKALASVSSEPAAPDHRVVRAESHRGVSYKVFQDFEDKDGTYSVVIEGGAHNGGAGWHQDGYKTVEDADAAAKASIDAYPEHYGAEPSTAMVVAQSTAAVVAEDRHYDDFRWDIPLDEQNAGRWVEAPLLGTWLTAYYQAPAEGGGYWVQFDPDSPYRRVSHIREIGAQVDPWGQPMPSKPAAPPEQITDAMRASVMARMVKAGGELPVGQLSDQDRAILAAIAPEYVETDGEVFRITNKGRKWLGTRKKVHAWAAARENDSVSCFPPPIPLWQHPECIPSNPAQFGLSEASGRNATTEFLHWMNGWEIDEVVGEDWIVARQIAADPGTPTRSTLGEPILFLRQGPRVWHAFYTDEATGSGSTPQAALTGRIGSLIENPHYYCRSVMSAPERLVQQFGGLSAAQSQCASEGMSSEAGMAQRWAARGINEAGAEGEVLPCSAVLHTDGSSLWSSRVAAVQCTKLQLAYVSDDGRFGELRVFFDPRTWDTSRDGIIYTDKQWIAELRGALHQMGFSEDAVAPVSREARGGMGYSEQGMQGDDYVSLDVGSTFIRDWSKIRHGEGRTWQLNEASARRFADVRAMLLDGLQAHGWSVARNLKVPHATSPDGQTRLWFKTQAIYMNDVGTDPRQFANAHSLAYDMREYQSVDELLAEHQDGHRSRSKRGEHVRGKSWPSDACADVERHTHPAWSLRDRDRPDGRLLVRNDGVRS